MRYFGVPDGEGGMTLEGHETGRGVRTGSALQNLSQGAFMATGDPLDVAVDGDGLLEVVLPNGQAAYTHGGSLKVDGTGRLVTSTGAEVPPRIEVPAGTTSMEIQPDGTVIAIASGGERQSIGQLQMVRFQNPEGLLQIGQNLLLPTEASGAADCRDSRARQGSAPSRRASSKPRTSTRARSTCGWSRPSAPTS